MVSDEVERLRLENAALRKALKPVLEHDCLQYGRAKNRPEIVKIVRQAQLIALAEGVA